MKTHYDVIVIGSGVAGALVAWNLAKVGLEVLVLEAGETGVSRMELVGKYAVAQPKTPHSPYRSKLGDKLAPSADSPDDYYDQQSLDTKNQYKSGFERRVGGSTSHWLGHTPRLLPNDFQMATMYRVGVDWPISYADIEPWYCAAERELGVSGDNDEWDALFGAFRSKPFPMTKIWPSYSDLVVQKALEHGKSQFEGTALRVFVMPSARNSEQYDGRPPCAGNSSCVPICPIQAKYDASIHVKKAMEAGATIQEQSVVTQISADSDGIIRKVKFKTWEKEVKTVSARVVVLAANAIESAKILLMSPLNDTTLANGSDQVGRNLMDHLQQTGLAIASEPLFPFRGAPSISGIDVLRDGPFRSDRSAFRISLGNDGHTKHGSPYADAIAGANSNLFGKELKEYIAQSVSRQLRLSSSTEVLPSQDNRVTLSKVKFDDLGLNRPAISFTASNYTRSGLLKARNAMGVIFGAIKATSSEFFEKDPGEYTGAGHIMGTCRMGSNEKMSVVDSDCRSHQHRNLFLAGSSVFPTCGTGNPTLTIAALALRTASVIKTQLAQDPK